VISIELTGVIYQIVFKVNKADRSLFQLIHIKMSAPDTKRTNSQLSEEFITNFNLRREEIAEKINHLALDNVSNLQEKLANVSAEIQNLNKTLHDAVMFLPSYSIKIRQNEIRELEKALIDKESNLIPKKKFGFRSKAVAPVNNPDVSSEIKDNTIKSESSISSSNSDNFFTIENVNNQTLQCSESQLNGNDVLVKNCENSTIVLEGGPSTLRLANLKGCKLLCGPVRTSTFVDSVRESTLFLCCQQLRTHSSVQVDIYLRVGSRAIIEDCSQIRFGPYEWIHEKATALHAKAEIDENLERYDAVDDFNWLAASASPNWTVIPPEDRVPFVRWL